jgi:hypothetical protein
MSDLSAKTMLKHGLVIFDCLTIISHLRVNFSIGPCGRFGSMPPNPRRIPC